MVPRYRSNCLVIVVILLVLQIIDVSCSNDFHMCDNRTDTGSEFFFTKTTTQSNCHCSVNTSSTNKIKIIFHTENNTSNGCKLKLVVMFMSGKEYYGCGKNEQIFKDIFNGQEIELGLEAGNRSAHRFEFGFKIESTPSDQPTTLSPSTRTPLETDMSPQSTSIATTPKPTEPTIQPDTSVQSTPTESTNVTTKLPNYTHSYSLPPDTSSTSYIPSTSRNTQKPQTSQQSSLSGIVGGSVTAIVVIVILIIIVVCVLKRRKYKSKTTSPAPDKNNYYFQLEIPNENADNGIVDHTYDNSSNTPPSKTNENTPADIRYDNLVISDNDLYVSSDAVENGLPSIATHPKTPDNNPAEIKNLVITDNDMYISSGDIKDGNLPDTQDPKPIVPDDSHYQSIDSLDQTSDQTNVLDTPRPEENNNKPLEATKLSFEPEYTTVNKAQKPKDSAKTNGDNSNANEDDSNHIKDNSKGDGNTPNSNDETPNSNGDNPNSNGDALNSNRDTTNSNGDAPNSNGDTTNSNGDATNSNDDTLNFNRDNQNSNGDAPHSNANATNVDGMIKTSM